MKATGAVIAGFVAFVLLTVGVWAVTVTWAPWKGAGDVRKQTQGNASFRIASYDHFYDLCGQARALQQNVKITRSMLRKSNDPAEKARQETNLQAQRNQLNELVATYNADARKTTTAGRFRASDLPFTLDASQEITCTA